MRETIKRIKKIKKSTLAIPAAPAATPPKPRIPAIIARTIKIIVHFNIIHLFLISNIIIASYCYFIFVNVLYFLK